MIRFWSANTNGSRGGAGASRWAPSTPRAGWDELDTLLPSIAVSMTGLSSIRQRWPGSGISRGFHTCRGVAHALDQAVFPHAAEVCSAMVLRTSTYRLAVYPCRTNLAGMATATPSPVSTSSTTSRSLRSRKPPHHQSRRRKFPAAGRDRDCWLTCKEPVHNLICQHVLDKIMKSRFPNNYRFFSYN